MIEAPPQAWSTLVPGDYVRDKEGMIWRIEDRRGDTVLLLNSLGEKTAATPPPDATPVRMIPSHDEAVAEVEKRLGADVLAVHTPGKPIQCPPLQHRLAIIHSHFFMAHGIYTASGPGSKAMKALLEAHREDHLNPDLRSHAWVNHEHH